MNIMKKQRNESIDILKGIAIFLVVVGHVIQYSSQGAFNFFSNKLFSFIYTFHMPLFMLISGYLFYHSFIKKDIKQTLQNKIQQLLYPIIIFTILNYYISVIIEIMVDGSLLKFLNANWVSKLSNIWFLWSVLASTIVICLSHALTKNKKNAFVLSLILCPIVYLFPNGDNNLFMYGFFITGFYFAQYKNLFPTKLLKLKYVFSLLFLIILPFWENDFYIYLTGMFNFSSFNLFFKQITVDIIRYVYGIAGSVFMITMVNMIVSNKNKVVLKLLSTLKYIGQKSLQIYLIQIVVIENLFNKFYCWLSAKLSYNILFVNKQLFNFVLVPTISIIFVFAILSIIKFIEKKNYSKFIFGR